MAASTGIFSSNNSAALRMTGSLIKRRTMQSSKHAFARRKNAHADMVRHRAFYNISLPVRTP